MPPRRLVCPPCPSCASMAARARLRALRALRALRGLGPYCALVLSAVACSREGRIAERLETAKALMALLDPTSDTYGGPAAVDAFLCGGGPSIMKYRLDSMDGML